MAEVVERVGGDVGGLSRPLQRQVAVDHAGVQLVAVRRHLLVITKKKRVQFRSVDPSTAPVDPPPSRPGTLHTNPSAKGVQEKVHSISMLEMNLKLVVRGPLANARGPPAFLPLDASHEPIRKGCRRKSPLSLNVGKDERIRGPWTPRQCPWTPDLSSFSIRINQSAEGSRY